jgi:hypothetical protein
VGYRSVYAQARVGPQSRPSSAIVDAAKHRRRGRGDLSLTRAEDEGIIMDGIRKLLPAVAGGLAMAVIVASMPAIGHAEGGEGRDSHEKSHDPQKKPPDPQKKPTGKTNDFFGTDGRGLTAGARS